jgi:hypothetical protein
MLDGGSCVRRQQKFKFEDFGPGPGGFSICGPCGGKIAVLT